MAKKRTQRRSKRNLGIALYVIAMISVIVVVAFYQRGMQPAKPPKKPASEYFSFSEIAAIGNFLGPDRVRITQLGFKIKAVGGNATEVNVVPYQGMVPLEEGWRCPEILVNQSVSAGPFMYPSGGIPIERQDSVFPVRFYVECREAEGYVWINLTDSDIFPI